MQSRALIAYVNRESTAIGANPIDVYTRAKICGSAIDAWSGKDTKVKQLLRYRIERSLCEIAMIKNIDRKMNEAIYKS